MDNTETNTKIESVPFKGRTVIYTNWEEITPDNVVEVINESLSVHRLNVAQIQYLWNYYRGQQPILDREKDVRPEICNKIVENHAQEIVAFKIGYQLAEPLQYTCRSYETEDTQESEWLASGQADDASDSPEFAKQKGANPFDEERDERAPQEEREEPQDDEREPRDERQPREEQPEQRDERIPRDDDQLQREEQRAQMLRQDQAEQRGEVDPREQRERDEQREEEQAERAEQDDQQDQRDQDEQRAQDERAEQAEQRDQEPQDEERDQDADNPFAKRSAKPSPFGGSTGGSSFGASDDQGMGSTGLMAPEKDDAYQKRLKDVNELNTLMFAEDKMSADRDLFEWMIICGVGYRMAEADKDEDFEEGGAPFEIYTLDPRNTFVVYSRAYHHRPVMAVWTGIDPVDDTPVYNVYTKDTYYLIKNDIIQMQESHTYGAIPIVEYRLNNARMGVFEPVLPLLDAINAIESNRIDGIEQTVQALMKFINCDVTEESFEAMLKLGAVKVSSPEGVTADVDVIKNDLDQTSTQVTKDDLYAAVINICGMPNRNGQTGSTSDTGAAVLLRDGWTLAESHAKGYELQFKRAERDFLKVILAICEQSADTDIDLRVRDVELAFNRRNYENILVKSQVLTTMLSQSKIHPQLAFQSCGLFTDPDAAYLMSKKHTEENRDQMMENNPFMASLYTGQPTAIGSQTNVPGPDNGDNEEKSKTNFPPRKA